MRIYLSGKMTGVPDFNYPAFHAAAARWRANGFTVFNPAESFDGDTTRPKTDYMRLDVAAVAASDAIALLPDWECSKGVSLEIAVGVHCGLSFFDADTGIALEVPKVGIYVFDASPF